VQKAGVSVSFLLRYLLAPSEHFLPKELSQIFGPIPGGGHATSRAELFSSFLVPMWRSMTVSSFDDNFDWTLTNEGTPTTNTGPSTGSGHGGGAFIHIEASGQTEGAYAAITSSATGCGLYIDYHMYGGGIGSLTVSAKDVAEGEDTAWVPVWTKEGDQGDSWQAATIYSASGSYYQVTATRGGGNRGDIAIDNLNLIWCTDAPTASPTNEGDTNTPTASPTPAPTATPTDAPTLVPTSTPTAAPTIDINNILNWADLKAICSASACDTANGGCTITLSDDFAMGGRTLSTL
jgi:hypothetical protein